MYISILRTKGIILLLTIPLLLYGCAYGPVKPTDVSEYRYFPEYGGYLPVVDNNIRADWVMPGGYTSDRKADYSAPPTMEEAIRRVNKTADRGKVVHPKVSGSIAILLYYPATVVMAAVVIPGYLVAQVLPTEEWSPKATEKKKEEEKQKQLEELAGISVRLQVKDGAGNVIPEPRVIEVVSPMDIPVYSDDKGLRSFAPASYNLYELSPRVLGLLTNDLQTYPGNKDNLTDWIGDQDGIVSNTSLAAGRFTSYMDDENWQWVRTPLPLNLSYIVWAPSYKPSLYTFSGVNHGDVLNATVTLDKLGPVNAISCDTTYNIWSLKEKYDNFALNYVALPNGYKNPQLVDIARDLLEKGSKVDPDFPGLDTPRMVIAAAEGDRERAITLSHYVSHAAYFRFYYGLKVYLP